jgi:hypothetical protein
MELSCHAQADLLAPPIPYSDTKKLRDNTIRLISESVWADGSTPEHN